MFLVFIVYLQLVHSNPIDQSQSITPMALVNWSESSAWNPEEGGDYMEGDILIVNGQSGRTALTADVSHWPNGIVPYEIRGTFSANDYAIIERAISIYHKYTCIKFRRKKTNDIDFIQIKNDMNGCWSSVGRIGGRQDVNLQSPACTTKVGTPIHELMHAIGFLHEQNRWERDDYVTIEWGNIKRGHENNFQKADKTDTDSFGVHYDYRSVMHYSPNAFSMNGRPTIVPKNYTMNIKMGQRDGFSRGDIEKINKLYGCPKNELVIDNSVTNHENKETNNGGGGGGILGFLYELITS